MLASRSETRHASSDWQRGLDVALATVQLEPAELTAQLGIEFHDGCDALDFFVAALARLPSGRQYALRQYRGAVGSGTSIITNWFSRSLSDDLEEALSLFGLDRAALVWLHPQVYGAGWVLWREGAGGECVPMRLFALEQAAVFARAECEAEHPGDRFVLEPARGDEPVERSGRLDVEVEFPRVEIWRGNPGGAGLRLHLAESRVLAEQLLHELRRRDPEAVYWTVPRAGR